MTNVQTQTSPATNVPFIDLTKVTTARPCRRSSVSRPQALGHVPAAQLNTLPQPAPSTPVVAPSGILLIGDGSPYVPPGNIHFTPSATQATPTSVLGSTDALASGLPPAPYQLDSAGPEAISSTSCTEPPSPLMQAHAEPPRRTDMVPSGLAFVSCQLVSASLEATSLTSGTVTKPPSSPAQAHVIPAPQMDTVPSDIPLESARSVVQSVFLNFLRGILLGFCIVVLIALSWSVVEVGYADM